MNLYIQQTLDCESTQRGEKKQTDPDILTIPAIKSLTKSLLVGRHADYLDASSFFLLNTAHQHSSHAQLESGLKCLFGRLCFALASSASIDERVLGRVPGCQRRPLRVERVVQNAGSVERPELIAVPLLAIAAYFEVVHPLVLGRH